MGYTRHAIRGASWNSLFKVGSTVLSAVKVIILARILSQQDFGLFALVAVTVGIVESVTETGINATILQSPKSISYFLDTAWVISIFRGVLISIAMLLAGFVMRGVYDSQQLFFLIGLASLVPIIKGFINPAIVSYQKDLLFFQDSMYRIAVLTVEVVSSIVLGIILKSAVALVIGLVISAIFEAVLTFWLFSEKPRFHYISSRAQEIFHNMKGLNSLAILGYLVENIDSIVVGKVVGTAGLGIYQNTYGLTHRLNLQLAKSVQHATFPVYVKMGEDLGRLRRAFLRTIISSLLGFAAISLPFFLFPTLAITFFLGSKWLEAVPLVRPLLIAGLLQSIVSISSALCISRKSYYWLNLNLLVTTIVTGGAVFFLGQQYGLIGAVNGLVIGRVAGIPFIVYGMVVALSPRPKQLHWRDRV